MSCHLQSKTKETNIRPQTFHLIWAKDVIVNMMPHCRRLSRQYRSTFMSWGCGNMWLSPVPVKHIDTVTVDSSGEVVNMCSYGRKENTACHCASFHPPYSITHSCHLLASHLPVSHGELSPAGVSCQSCVSWQTHLRLCVLAVTATSIIGLETECRTGAN